MFSKKVCFRSFLCEKPRNPASPPSTHAFSHSLTYRKKSVSFRDRLNGFRESPILSCGLSTQSSSWPLDISFFRKRFAHRQMHERARTSTSATPKGQEGEQKKQQKAVAEHARAPPPQIQSIEGMDDSRQSGQINQTFQSARYFHGEFNIRGLGETAGARAVGRVLPCAFHFLSSGCRNRNHETSVGFSASHSTRSRKVIEKITITGGGTEYAVKLLQL